MMVESWWKFDKWIAVEYRLLDYCELIADAKVELLIIREAQVDGDKRFRIGPGKSFVLFRKGES